VRRADSYEIYSTQGNSIRSAIEAGIQHWNLASCQDDIWLTILSQMTFCVNSSREEESVNDELDNIQGNGHFISGAMLFLELEVPVVMKK
jgi:hypothetical protein